MNPTPSQLLAAIKTMRLAIAFVPTSEEDTAIILMSLGKMVATTEQLNWLVYVACNVMGKWSLAELRGLFCSRYDPADGIPAECTLPGWTPAEVARRNEAQPVTDPTRLLPREPEPEPSEEERKDWAALQAKIRSRAAQARIAPARSPRPTTPKDGALDLRAAEEELARRVRDTPPLSDEAMARAVRELERKLGLGGRIQ